MAVRNAPARLTAVWRAGLRWGALGVLTTLVGCAEPQKPAGVEHQLQRVVTERDTFRRRFRRAGTFRYHCEIHAGMTATITVN